MKVAHLSFVVTLIASGIAHAATPTEIARSKTSRWLWNQTHSFGNKNLSSFEALVYMRDQADLSPSRQIQSKADKGRFVRDTLTRTAEESQKSLRGWLETQKVSYQPHWVANMIVVKGATAAVLEHIAVRDDVLRVVGNPQLKNSMPQAEKSEFLAAPLGVGQNILRVQADKVWAKGFTGQGIVIAGQDTGVQWDHPALKPQYRGWNGSSVDHSYSWHDAIKERIEGGSRCGYNVSVPCDDSDHGTHTVGTIVGDDGAGNQIGVAPGAKWIACRNMDNGIGRPSTYIDCFEWFLAPYRQGEDSFKSGDPAVAPHVINNSWGCPAGEGCEGGEFEPILKALEAAGIFVVVSAGNSGPSCSTISDGPAFNTAHVLSVGAMDSTSNRIASFSSRGPSTFDNLVGPHVAAPGVNIRSAVPGSRYAQFGWSGTSMAGPHVAGQVALLWSAQPELIGDIANTRNIIMKSAQATQEASQSCGGVSGRTIPNNTWGFGTIDTLKALTTSF